MTSVYNEKVNLERCSSSWLFDLVLMKQISYKTNLGLKLRQSSSWIQALALSSLCDDS